MSYDAVVIGAGHNGLVCAAYLARAGMSVLVLERRDALGGMAGTSELLKGVRVPTLAHTVGRLRPSIARELGLRGHGLALVQPEVRAFAPQPDGRAITLWGDVDRTARDIAESGLAGTSDAESYGVVDQQVRALGRGLAELMSRVPPDLASPTLGDAFAGLRTGLAARARARSANESLLRTMPMAARDLVGEWLESDALRAAIAARGMLYSGLSPRMPGSGGVLLADLAGNDGGLAGQTVFARGGPGALADALAAAARAHGVEIRTGAAVARVRRDGERVTGVMLSGGEEIDAPIVVSNLDPRTTLLDLFEPEVLGPRLSWRAANIRQRGTTAKINLALSGLPDFGAAGGDARLLRGRILIAPSMRYLDLAARPAKYGELPDRPLLEATIPTLVDPGLLADGRRGRAEVGCPRDERRGRGHSARAARRDAGRSSRRARRCRARGAGRVRAGHREPRSRAPGHHAARHRARPGGLRRSCHARGGVARPVVRVATASRPRPLPDAADRHVPRRLRRTSRRWRDRWSGPARCPGSDRG